MGPDDEERRLRARLAELEAARSGEGAAPQAKGVPVKPDDLRGWSPVLVAVAGLGGLILLGMVAANPDKPPASPPSPVAQTAKGESWVAPEYAGWAYSENPDAMSDQPTKLACIVSADQVSLSFPYSSQSLKLCIRRSARQGFDAFLMLPDGGQFLCRSYDGCVLRARIDGGPAIAWSGASASDGSSDVVFWKSATKFAHAVRAARKFVVEAEFYQAGRQSVTFYAPKDLEIP